MDKSRLPTITDYNDTLIERLTEAKVKKVEFNQAHKQKLRDYVNQAYE